MKLYFVTNIVNFNKIFSLEFLLPEKLFKSLYSYEKSEYDLFGEYITFYKVMPRFSKEHFVIEVNVKDEFDLIKINEYVYIYPRAFKIKNIKTIFLNDDVKKVMVGRSIVTSEVKNMKYYIKTFSSMENLENEKLINISSINTISNYKKNPLVMREIYNMNSYDRLLGGIYYSMFHNKASIITKKNIYYKYAKMMKLYKLGSLIDQKNMMYRDIKSGFSKQIKKFEKKISKMIIESNGFVFLDNNFNYRVKHNHKFNYNDKDLDVFFIILNELCNYETDIKDALINIGENLRNKELSFYLEDLRILYDIIINGKIQNKIENIKSEIIKSFFIALLKFDNINEIPELCKQYNLSNDIYAHFLAGMIQGYSSISKIIIDQVNKDKITSMVISNEVKMLDYISQTVYERQLYKLILKLKKQQSIYRLINSIMQKKVKNIDLKRVRKDYLKILIKIDGTYYVISLSGRKNNSFMKKMKKLNLNVNNGMTYKSFSIHRIHDENKVCLSCIDRYELIKYLKQLLNLIY